MKYSRGARAMFVVLLTLLVSVWLAPVAQAQLDIGDPVGDAVGGGLIGDVTDGLEGGTNDSGSGGETSSGDGGLVGGVIGGTVDKVKETIDSGKETVGEVTNEAGGTVGDVTGGAPLGNVGSGLVGTVEETVDKVKNDLTGTGKKRQHNTRPGDRKDTSSPTRTGSDVMAHSFAGALEADGKEISLAMDEANALSAASVTADESLISQIGRIATEAAKQAAFPLALTLLVIGFLMVQNRIDKKDPKLALAPVDSEHDLLSFT